MNTYRLYTVDRTGKITSAEKLEAETDEDALTIARCLCKHSSRELWRRSSFVAAIPASSAEFASLREAMPSDPQLQS